MGSPLPEIREEEFRRRLATSIPRLRPLDREGPSPRRPVVSDETAGRLYRHYAELRRWNPRVSLVGPGTAEEIVERHYGESLAALPLIPAGARHLVDVGSGAGFPGLVLAVASEDLSHEDLSHEGLSHEGLLPTLVEPRQKKWAFLEAAARKAGLSCRCLNARVGGGLPAGLPANVDLVTCRALKMAPESFGHFVRHSPQVRFLLWYGEGAPELPRQLEVRRRWALTGSRNRRILEVHAVSRELDT